MKSILSEIKEDNEIINNQKPEQHSTIQSNSINKYEIQKSST